MTRVQFGLDTFGDVTQGPDGTPLPHAEVLRNVVAEGVLADQLGLDAFNVGEHHRSDFAISAPDVVLAALAGQTEQIALGTAVTVLSSDDPVRVYERFATLDALSRGRAEITLGRGSFTESFPLFGYDLADYERLFEEKLELFAALRSEQRVQWSGTVRGPLDAELYPKTEARDDGTVGFPAWVGVGGSPESVVRAARLRFPLMLAIIGGEPARFAPYADLYRRALDQLHPGAPELTIGMHSPGFVWDDDDKARELLFPHFKANRDRIGKERGWPPSTVAQLHEEADFGALYVGSPETVATKIAASLTALGAQRFDLKYSNGPMPHDQLMRSIELYATEVVPRVRRLLGE